MGFRQFCALVRGWLAVAYSYYLIGRETPVLWLSIYPDHVPFFPLGQPKGFGVSRVLIAQMGLVSRIHAVCTSLDTALRPSCALFHSWKSV
ncbi:hypothetical protein TNCV_287241 [Trichonephila clavipes]|nr:hypothetical protein TNCV_287241 [Trichonephila clavipes]